MTPEQISKIYNMMEMAIIRFDGDTSSRAEELAAIQAYANCLIALHTDRIATALERPTPNYDPHVSTALNRIAQATEGLESVLPRQ
jgi:hypothetical protein